MYGLLHTELKPLYRQQRGTCTSNTHRSPRVNSSLLITLENIFHCNLIIGCDFWYYSRLWLIRVNPYDADLDHFVGLYIQLKSEEYFVSSCFISFLITTDFCWELTWLAFSPYCDFFIDSYMENWFFLWITSGWKKQKRCWSFCKEQGERFVSLQSFSDLEAEMVQGQKLQE